MRDLGVIDGELRLVTRAWRVAREMSHCTPSIELIDQLLDERMAVAGSPLHSRLTSSVQPVGGSNVHRHG